MVGVATLSVIVTMTLALVRALSGPTAFDRVLAVNMFGTKTVLLIALLGFLAGRPDFLDMALAYALLNFVGTLTILKYIEYGDLGAAESSLDQEKE